jgi:hypothetical protein
MGLGKRTRRGGGPTNVRGCARSVRPRCDGTPSGGDVTQPSDMRPAAHAADPQPYGRHHGDERGEGNAAPPSSQLVARSRPPSTAIVLVRRTHTSVSILGGMLTTTQLTVWDPLGHSRATCHRS